MRKVLWSVVPFYPTSFNPAMELSPDKLVAMDALLAGVQRAGESSDRVVMVLTGAAGTGKTTIMKELARRVTDLGFTVMYAAPTGKAASRLRESTGEETSTLHSFLYGTPKEMGICPSCGHVSEQMGMTPNALRRLGYLNFECPECRLEFPFSMKDSISIELHWEPSEKLKAMGEKVLLIVDESSMVGPMIYEDVLSMVPKKWPILWVGDREQLKPVPSSREKTKYPSRTWGPDFQSPTANLTVVHRQSADNPIINLATRIRMKINDADPLSVNAKFETDPRLRILRAAPFAAPVKWLAEERKARKDSTLIAWTNVMRRKLNFAVREARGLAAESAKQRLRVVKSDRLAVLRNHRSSGMMNGEVFIVNASRKGPDLEGNPTLWVQLWPKPDWYLLAADGFNPTVSDFDDRAFRDVFEPYTSTWFKFIRIIEKAEEAGIPSRLDPELEDLMGLLQEAQEADRQKAMEAKGKPPMEYSDIIASCDRQLRVVDQLAAKFNAIPSNYPLYADYGECLTAHKAQGSQFKSVGVVLDSGFDARWRRDLEEARRWLYTAITRASENLIVWKL